MNNVKFGKVLSVSTIMLVVAQAQPSHAGFVDAFKEYMNYRDRVNARDEITRLNKENDRLSYDNSRLEREKVEKWKEENCRSRSCWQMAPQEHNAPQENLPRETGVEVDYSVAPNLERETGGR